MDVIYKKEDWVYAGRWVQTPLSGWFWNNWSQNNEKFPFSLHLRGEFLAMDGHYFLRVEDIAAIRAFTQKQYNDFEFLKKFDQWLQNIYQNSLTIKELHSSKLTLSQKLNRFNILFKDAITASEISVTLGMAVDELFQEYCKKQKMDYNAIVHSIKPKYSTHIVQLQQDASTLYAELSKLNLKDLSIETIGEENPPLAKKIKIHVEKFAFYGVFHFVGEQYSVEKFLRNYETLSKKVPANNQIKEQTNNWYEEALSITIFARTFTAEICSILEYEMLRYFREANQVLGLKKDEYLWLTLEELMAGIANPKAFTIPNITARKEKYGYLVDGPDQRIITGQKVMEVLSVVKPQEKLPTFPLKGIITAKGIKQGIAKVINSPQDLHKINTGDIIVAPEITLEYYDHIRKVAAIITNKGGITSHTAILGREFNIPCIAGVAHATEVIFDGDMIEVDANQGIIRKI